MLNLCGFAWIGGSLESRINPAGLFLLPTSSGDSAVAPFGTMGFLWIVGESVLEQDDSGKGQVRWGDFNNTWGKRFSCLSNVLRKYVTLDGTWHWIVKFWSKHNFFIHQANCEIDLDCLMNQLRNKDMVRGHQHLGKCFKFVLFTERFAEIGDYGWNLTSEMPASKTRWTRHL